MKYEDLEELLGNLQSELIDNMLKDLSDPDKRSPQLYNAIIKELERNGINCIPKAGDGDEGALNKLLKATQQKFEEDYGNNDNIADFKQFIS